MFLENAYTSDTKPIVNFDINLSWIHYVHKEPMISTMSYGDPAWEVIFPMLHSLTNIILDKLFRIHFDFGQASNSDHKQWRESKVF